MAEARVALCIPSMDHVHADFAMCLAALANDPGALLMIINAKASNIALARNNCVQGAIDSKADWMLFLDTDMLFPQDTLRRLLGHRRDIVGATYAQRVRPHATIGAMVGQAARAHVDSRLTPLVEMERMPTGCMLINMRVFQKLSKPYFQFGTDLGGGIISEDFIFCQAARAAKIKVWCDTRLSEELGHIGTHVYKVQSTPREDFTVDAAQLLAAGGGEAA